MSSPVDNSENERPQPTQQNSQNMGGKVDQAKRQARLEHDPKWFGERHVEPEQGDPDREFIYAKNDGITDKEVQEVLQAYQNSIKDPETGNYDSQAVHLRPSTPPMKRARRQLEGLKDQGVEVTEGIEKEVINHYTRNNGIVAALIEWCQGEEVVPVEHARELLNMNNRLKLEMATQQRDLQYELNKANQSVKNSAMEAISLKAQANETQTKYDLLIKEYGQLLVEKQSSQQAIKDLKHERDELWVGLKMIPKDKKDLADRLKRYEEESKAKRKDLKKAEEDVQRYKSFHDKAFEEQKVHAQTWILTKQTYDEMPPDDRRANPVLRTILDEVAKSWRELGSIYEKEWRPIAEALEQGNDRNGTGLLSLFDQKEEELKAKEKDLKDLRQSLAERTRDIRQKDWKIEGLRESNEKLKRELDETSVPPSTPSTEAPRNPTETGKNTPEHRRVSSVTSLAPSTTSIQMEEEIKRLKRENSDLRQKLAGKSEDKEKPNKASETAPDNKKAGSSTGSSPEEGYGLKAAHEEIENLKTQVQEQAGDIKQLNQRMSKREEEFKMSYRNSRHEANIHRNRLKAMESVNFRTADSLALAIGNEKNGVYNKRHLSLMDRMNYLNLACFFRTRNYIQLALREGSVRLASALLIDAQRWTEFCHEDFARMDPSVNILIGASMHILYGIRKILTTKTEEDVVKARTNIQRGREILAEYPHEFTFFQLHQLADTILNRIEDGQGTGLYKKRPRFSFSGRFHTEKKLKSPVQREIKANLSPKAARLGYAGLDSPLSPDNWNKNNVGKGLSFEESVQQEAQQGGQKE